MANGFAFCLGHKSNKEDQNVLGHCIRGELRQLRLYTDRVLSSSASFCPAASSVSFIEGSARSEFHRFANERSLRFLQSIRYAPANSPGPWVRPLCFASSMVMSLAKRILSPGRGPLCLGIPLLGAEGKRSGPQIKKRRTKNVLGNYIGGDLYVPVD